MHYITIECDTWGYETYPCGSGGGGGGGGGDIPGVPDPFTGGGGEPGGGYMDYNPCDPIGPPMQIPPMECNVPCDWMDPTLPWMCGEPCTTRNPVIDDVFTQSAMDEYWKISFGTESSPLPHHQRNEAVIFITQSGNSYQFIEIQPSNVSSCHWNATSVSKPSNLIGVLHIHPYAPGDSITDQRCLDYRQWTPPPQYPTYNPDVSSGDSGMVTLLQVPLYIMDKEKIRVLLPSHPNQYSSTFNRCGY